MDSELAGKPAPRNDDIPAFFRTLLVADAALRRPMPPNEIHPGWFSEIGAGAQGFCDRRKAG
jgi:hypothetical protein